MTIDRRTILVGAAALALAKPAVSSEPDTPKAQAARGPAERVLGIGGLFFRSRDPQKLAQWYEEHLGVDPVPTAYGQSGWEQAAGPTAFAPFPQDTKYLGTPEHQWMINFRVRELDAMVTQLQSAGVEVKVDPNQYPNGRFARLHDPEGNAIELWEPAKRT